MVPDSDGDNDAERRAELVARYGTGRGAELGDSRAGMFLDFITDALYPRIERDYSTAPSGQGFNDREILGDLAVYQNPAKNVATFLHRPTSRGGSVTSALMHETHVTLVDRVDRTGCGASSRSGPRMIASGYVTTFLFQLAAIWNSFLLPLVIAFLPLQRYCGRGPGRPV
ncbi:hypothetical protein CF54_15815 [Streptomyces sp. Tu 6176]|uniref:hypothetical protein n=1 Tax=Streptomyces sp. Tu 6176 TaxID=1470557 RepID=UPI00044C3B5F|nr:hypothetical protein [Streptomyces sp. Tu 6176]EYT82030.1 hypothetical protein CF54_15815 [Streptomyces sp. Tu 6176]